MNLFLVNFEAVIYLFIYFFYVSF